MSLDSVYAFLDHVKNNNLLQKEIASLRGGNSVDILLMMAREVGYDFSRDEYHQVILELAEGELSDESIHRTAQAMGMETDKMQ